jgi:hypothetical protein
LGAVYHIFVPHGDDSWTWVATVPEPLTQEEARRMVACFRREDRRHLHPHDPHRQLGAA